MIHGILHLCGFDDQTEAAQAVMRAEENKALSMMPF
jgi:ssRNA-specific RNase YbeY (16S rRNA maturation enzyme)